MEEFEDGDDRVGVFQPPCAFCNIYYIIFVDFILFFSICVLGRDLFMYFKWIVVLLMLFEVGLWGLGVRCLCLLKVYMFYCRLTCVWSDKSCISCFFDG